MTSTPPPLAPAVFLDRDDTLIACRSVVSTGDLGDPALVRLLPGAAELCARLKHARYQLIVISNQGGVARGAYTIDAVHAVNHRANELLDHAIDAFYFCPFHPRGALPEFAREHPWRKPAPGMILAAAAQRRLDLARSWLIGDNPRDCRAGRAAGIAGRTILLTRPDPDLPPTTPPDLADASAVADHLAPDLRSACARILGGAPE